MKNMLGYKTIDDAFHQVDCEEGSCDSSAWVTIRGDGDRFVNFCKEHAMQICIIIQDKVAKSS